MSRGSLTALVLFALGTAAAFGRPSGASETDAIIALERGALERWGRGDPYGYLDIYARDVSYFDPAREKRVDGFKAMEEILAPLKGVIQIDSYEMIAPRVDLAGEAAILTYNLINQGRLPDGTRVVSRWNATAVFVRRGGAWKILHNHWSYTKPDLKQPNLP
jgi:ketosteroid isomerase-like protein